MNVQIYSRPRLMPSLKVPTDSKREPGDTIIMQEQFTGLLPPRAERLAAEVLAERLAESVPIGAPPAFIP